jgi:hypothetical protein
MKLVQGPVIMSPNNHMDAILQDCECKSTEIKPTFQKNTLPPSSVSKNKSTKKTA